MPRINADIEIFRVFVIIRKRISTSFFCSDFFKPLLAMGKTSVGVINLYQLHFSKTDLKNKMYRLFLKTVLSIYFTSQAPFQPVLNNYSRIGGFRGICKW